MAKKVKKTEERQKCNVYGWTSIDDVAREVYDGPVRDLLEGVLVFAYKNPGDSGTVKFLVVTKTKDSFRFGFISQTGWTCYYPKTTLQYLNEVILEDLKKNKTENYIIEDFIDYINYYDKA